MYPADRTLNRQLQQSLYMLKRQYGGTIDIYKLLEAATDAKTGEKVLSIEVTRIERAVVLPATIEREAEKTVSQISANKQFVVGGTFDTEVREFIVDRRDTPRLPELTDDDWVVFKGVKYQIKSFEEFEFEAGWVITAKAVVGEAPEEIHVVAADNLLGMEQAVIDEP